MIKPSTIGHIGIFLHLIPPCADLAHSQSCYPPRWRPIIFSLYFQVTPQLNSYLFYFSWLLTYRNFPNSKGQVQILKVSWVILFIISKTRKIGQTFVQGEDSLFRPSRFLTSLSLSASKISNLEGNPREIFNLEGLHSKEAVSIPLYIKFSKKLPCVFQRKNTLMC